MPPAPPVQTQPKPGSQIIRALPCPGLVVGIWAKRPPPGLRRFDTNSTGCRKVGGMGFGPRFKVHIRAEGMNRSVRASCGRRGLSRRVEPRTFPGVGRDSSRPRPGDGPVEPLPAASPPSPASSSRAAQVPRPPGKVCPRSRAMARRVPPQPWKHEERCDSARPTGRRAVDGSVGPAPQSHSVRPGPAPVGPEQPPRDCDRARSSRRGSMWNLYRYAMRRRADPSHPASTPRALRCGRRSSSRPGWLAPQPLLRGPRAASVSRRRGLDPPRNVGVRWRNGYSRESRHARALACRPHGSQLPSPPQSLDRLPDRSLR